MSFMTPSVSACPDVFVVPDDGEGEIEFASETPLFQYMRGYVNKDDLDMLAELYDDEELEAFAAYFDARPRVESIEIVEKYWGWLSAPGYLDRTDLVLGDTQAEVARQLLDLYYDRAEEDMTDDEKEEAYWLQEIVDGQSMYQENKEK